jgi:hypothetical protein
MKYIHMKNLEEYNPGYQDRHLIWCKAYFKMNTADPEFEMLCEIDKWRFMAFIMLELQIKKPILMDKEYLSRKGFDFKKRKLEETLTSLSQSIEIIDVTEEIKVREVSVTQNRVEENRIEENRVEKSTHQDFVLLSPVEFKSLTDDYGSLVITKYITSLNSYIGSKGKKYKSHYHTILNWLNRDQVKKKQKEVMPAREEPRWGMPSPEVKAELDAIINATSKNMAII